MQKIAPVPGEEVAIAPSDMELAPAPVSLVTSAIDDKMTAAPNQSE